MTDQEAFDIMVRHLAGMTHQSVSADEECVYRAPDGNKCVFGALIPDGAYSSEMEGWTANGVLDRFDLPPSVRGVDRALLSALQGAHDGGEWSDDGFDDWRAVRRIASEFGLSDAVVDEVLP